MKPYRLLPVVLASLMLTFSAVAQAGDIQTTPVQFAKGSSAATIKGSIKGDQTIDYTCAPEPARL